MKVIEIKPHINSQSRTARFAFTDTTIKKTPKTFSIPNNKKTFKSHEFKSSLIHYDQRLRASSSTLDDYNSSLESVVNKIHSNLKSHI